MSPLPAFIFNRVQLGLYDLLYPGQIPPNEARIEVEHRTLDLHSPDRHLLEEVQSEWLCTARFNRGEQCFVAI
ncbi:MAG: hypothetical protein V3U53_09505, partial [bacterium]